MTGTTPNPNPPGGPYGPYGPAGSYGPYGPAPGQGPGFIPGQAPGPVPGHPPGMPPGPPPGPPPGWGNPYQDPENWGPGGSPSTSPSYREWRTVREWAQLSPGCFTLVLFMPLGIPLVTLYSLTRSARSRAHTVFSHPAQPVADDTLSRVKKTRAVLALLASTSFLFAYGTRTDVEEALAGGAIRLMIAPWLLVLTAPLLVFLLMRWASQGEHTRMRSELRTPLVTLAKYVGALTAVPLLALAVYPLMTATEDAPFLAFLLAVATLLGLYWAAVFTVFSSSLVVRSGFGTGGIHKALPALLTALLVWEFTPVALLQSGFPPGPFALSLLFVLGGPLSVTAVAWWEVRRLTTRHGVVLRA